MKSNIPTLLGQQDFYDNHKDILAAARGEGGAKPKIVQYEMCDPNKIFFMTKDGFHFIDGDMKVKSLSEVTKLLP